MVSKSDMICTCPTWCDPSTPHQASSNSPSPPTSETVTRASGAITNFITSPSAFGCVSNKVPQRQPHPCVRTDVTHSARTHTHMHMRACASLSNTYTQICKMTVTGRHMTRTCHLAADGTVFCLWTSVSMSSTGMYNFA